MPTRKRMNSRKTRKTRKSRKTRVNKLNVRNRTRRRGRGKRHHKGSGGQGSKMAAPVEEDALSDAQAPLELAELNKKDWPVFTRQGSFNVTEAKDAAAAAAALKDSKVGLAGIGNIRGYLGVSRDEVDRAIQEKRNRVAKRQRAVDRMKMSGGKSTRT